MRYPKYFNRVNFKMIITSRANPVVRKLISLSDKKFRRQYGEYLVEGIKPVNECLAAGCEVTNIYCTEQLSPRYEGATVLSDGVFAAVSSEKSPQGVIATVKIPQKDIVPPDSDCLLLDRIQDPGNLGTIIRTANAAGYTKIYCIGCADVWSPKVVRASMSGVFFVDCYDCDEDEALEALDGVPIITADMDGEDIFSFVAPEKFCLCIGNEGSGVSERIRNLSRYTVRIPMRPTCESLNAGVSAAIAMYALKNNR